MVRSITAVRILLLAAILGLSILMLRARADAPAIVVPPPRVDLPGVEANYDASHQVEISDGVHMLGHGSGEVISTDGYVLTNDHVVDEAPMVVIRLRGEDGRMRPVPATVVARDPIRDLAVIRVPVRFRNAVTLGTESEIRAGMQVYNIGYPYDAGKTIDRGYVKQVDLHPDATDPTKPIIPRLYLDIPDGHGTSGSGIYSMETGHLISIMEAYVVQGVGRSPMFTRITVPVTVIKQFLDEHRIPYTQAGQQAGQLRMRDPLPR
jgi:serine protease Do